MMNTERMEIKRAVKGALNNLYSAREELSSARGLGIYDILGGGFFSSAMKHDRIEKAQEYLLKARRNVESYSRELSNNLGLNNFKMVKNDGIMAIADIFFDNPFTDIAVQSQIKDLIVDVDESIERTEYFLERLAV